MSRGGHSSETAYYRPSARLIVLDDDDRVLLFHDSTATGASLWFPPGGGLEAGEAYEDAARRELWEETGLRDPDLGPCIWTREHTWSRTLDDAGESWFQSVERYYLVRTPAFEPRPRLIDEYEAYMREPGWWAWWSLAAIREADGREIFGPRRLAELLVPLLNGEIPDMPLNANDP